MTSTESDDDELVSRLRDALGTPLEDPSPREVSAFRRLVATHFAQKRRRRWWHRSIVVPIPLLIGVSALLLALASAVLFANGRLPDQLRPVVRAVGIQVDSPDLAHARDTVNDLRAALGAGDREAVGQEAEALRAELGAMNAGDRAEVDAEAERLLTDAELFLMTHPQGSG